MTTTPAPRRSGLGRGLGRLIPLGSAAPSLDEQIAASVAALPLPAGRPGTRWDPTTTTTAWLRSRRSAHTRRAYFRDLAHYLAWLESVGVDPLQATRADVDCYLADLRAGPCPPSAASLNRRLAALSSWYRYLVDVDVAVRNPVTAVDRAPVDRDFSPTVSLTVAEVRALLRAADAAVARLTDDDSPLWLAALRNRALLGVLATLGLRVGEAIALDVTDLGHDEGHRVLTVQGKGGRSRRLPLPAAAARDLDAYLVTRRDRWVDADIRSRHAQRLNGIKDNRGFPAHATMFTRLNAAALQLARELAELHEIAQELPPAGLTGPLFATAGKQRLTQAYVFDLVRRLAHAAGLPAAARISPHSLRHTAATAALDDGAPLRDVQDLLGHADPRTTRRYDRHRGSLDRSPAHRLCVLYAG